MPFWSDLFCTNKIPNSLCLLVSRSAHARRQFYCGAWFTNCAQMFMIGMIAVTHVCLCKKKNPLGDIVLVKRVSWQMSGAWNLLWKKCYTILCSEGWVENDYGWGCMIKSFRVKWSCQWPTERVDETIGPQIQRSHILFAQQMVLAS